MVSGGQARSGWLSSMNRNSVDPDRLAVRMNTGGPPSAGPAAASGARSEIGASVMGQASHENATGAIARGLPGGVLIARC